jgi:hypothetical protein
MIYFIHNVERRAIKIGYAANPIQRMRALQTGLPDTLELMGSIEGDMCRERDLHRRFESFRIRGEWFRADFTLIAAIQDLLSPPSETESANGSWDVAGPAEDVVCPHPGCQFNYLRPVKVEVNRGGEITTIDHEGTRLSLGTSAGRGVSIEITFIGECGHVSSLNFQFHKGVTEQYFFNCIEVGEPSETDEPAAPVIWRD